MSEKIHYVYLTTNIISGKQYVGDHTINSKEKRYYIGSGEAFLDAVKSYGESNFFKEILEWFETRKDSHNAETFYIKKFNTLVPNGYNISPTGGLNVQGCFSEESKKKMSIHNVGMKGKHHSEKSKEKIRKGNKDLKRSIETKEKIQKATEGENHPNWGKHLSQKTKDKIKDGNLNKTHPKEFGEKIGKALKGREPWNKGLKYSRIN